MGKNYYSVLGVLPSATLEEIRSAYRRRAKQYHPDHFGKDSAPFINIQEAYDVLGDPVNRAVYDRAWKRPERTAPIHARSEPEVIRSRRSGVEPLRSRPRPAGLRTISPLDSFASFRPSADEILDNLWNAFGFQAQRKGDRFQTLTMEVVLTPDQADRGGRVRVLLPIEAVCPTCGGSGDAGFWQCWRCGGAGTSRRDCPLEVEYPPGTRDFYQVAIPLDRLGIPDICVILLFRVSREGDFEGP